MRLSRVCSFTLHRQCKSLKACGRLTFIQQQLVQAEQNPAAVDPSGKRNANGCSEIVPGEPPAQFVVNCFDVMATNEIQILWQCAARRIKETPMHGIGIGTPDQTQCRDVVRGNHARVAGVELVCPPTPFQLRGDLVDALGDDQRWSIGSLGEKISQRTVETSRQYDLLPVLRNERKRAVDAKNCIHVTSE